MRVIRDNLARLAFALGLLLGVQVPNFITQYEQRVSAHLAEAEHNFAGFRRIADQYFGGDVARLVAHHEASADRVFHAEAEVIRRLQARITWLQAEQAALQRALPLQVLHLATAADAAIRAETRREYEATVPLTLAAILSGLAGAALAALAMELLLAGLARLLRRGPYQGRAHLP